MVLEVAGGSNFDGSEIRPRYLQTASKVATWRAAKSKVQAAKTKSSKYEKTILM